MTETQDQILEKCSKAQATRIREFLRDHWKIEEYNTKDKSVVIRKGHEYKIVLRNGHSAVV